MSDGRISDLPLQPGSVGRKTGFQVTRTPRRGANGLEDPEDFFLSDDEFESQDISNTSPAKRLSMRYELEKGRKQELKSTTDPFSRQTLDRKDSSQGVSKIVAQISHNIFADSDDDKDIAEDDIDEVIKKAEKIGTPIKVVRRTLTSIDGSPGVKSNVIEHTSLQSMRKSVLNGAKLTKSIALNKTNDSTFQPQLITNAPHYDTNKVPELTSSETENNDNTQDSDSSKAEENVTENKEPSTIASNKSLEVSVEELNKPHEQPATTYEPEKETNNSDILENELQADSAQNSGAVEKAEESSEEKSNHVEPVETALSKLQSETIEELEKNSTLDIVERKPLRRLDSLGIKISTKNKTPKKTKYKEVSDADLVKELNKKGTSPITPIASRRIRAQKKTDLNKAENVSHLVLSESEDDSEEESESNDVKSPVKSITRKTSKPTLTKKATKQSKKVIETTSPVRRSTRTRVPPVASWKNEKIVYKTEKINGVIVKSVTNVQHVENIPATKPRTYKRKADVIDLSQSPGPNDNIVTKKTKKSIDKTTKVDKPAKAGKPAKTGKPVKADKLQNLKVLKIKKSTESIPKKRTASKNVPSTSTLKRKKQKVSHEEEMETDSELANTDFDNEKDSKTMWQKREDGALTLSLFEGPGTEKQVERTVAFAPNCYKNVTLIKSEDEHFKVGTLFDQDSEFCGGGIIELPPGSKKAVKSNHDTYFIFYVICGEIEVTLSRNTFVVTEGCSFEIPMGNYYQFINTSNKVAKMMFVQSKYVVIGTQDGDDDSEDGTLDSEDDD